jgi:hypothetical protein
MATEQPALAAAAAFGRRAAAVCFTFAAWSNSAGALIIIQNDGSSPRRSRLASRPGKSGGVDQKASSATPCCASASHSCSNVGTCSGRQS